MKGFLHLVPVLFVIGCATPHADDSESLFPGRNVLRPEEIQAALESHVDFGRHVKPILQSKCIICHDEHSKPGGLNLESREAAEMSGVFGVFIVPGNSKRSLLIAKIHNAPAHIKAMPPVGERLTPEEMKILQRWVDQGAVWPNDQ
jgi:hypothetical protein